MTDASSKHENHESADNPLPAPGSGQLKTLQLSARHEMLYSFLYEHMHAPPTMREIRAAVAATEGDAPSQTDRRVRDLRGLFNIETIQSGHDYRYLLKGLKPTTGTGIRQPIAKRLRAQILSPQRCAQCGKTPLDHHIQLDVDHKVPVEWGGSDDASNLQPLCQDCNAGKKAYFATYNQFTTEIRAAANHDEPHRRIGELLKAFEGDWVPSDLLGAVASIKQYQEDWQKRLRELRTLGWIIPSRRQKDATTGRLFPFYRAAHWEPWPIGNIAAEIKRIENSKKGK